MSHFAKTPRTSKVLPHTTFDYTLTSHSPRDGWLPSGASSNTLGSASSNDPFQQTDHSAFWFFLARLVDETLDILAERTIVVALVQTDVRLLILQLLLILLSYGWKRSNAPTTRLLDFFVTFLKIHFRVMMLRSQRQTRRLLLVRRR
mmetsp:Transcript_5071/g.14238  ORF Transcript_5071/g.14238 Transcript_5071/m.14238 type:complete len:147 (+) Transcript_5071:155-595(+)